MLALLDGSSDQRMMPGDTEQALLQFGALPPGPDEDHQPPDHSGPPGEQASHYDWAWLAYSSSDAAEVIGRLRSVEMAYPNSR